jgi:peptidoglycan hydrolase-like protein with peptidoglycan-binding domain
MKVDGDFGLRTAAAVFRVQEKLGRTPTGRVSTALLRILRGDEKPAAKPSKPAPKPDPAPKHVPTTRERVLDLQRAVHAAPDGVWGPDTDRRVAALSAASRHGGRKFPHGVKLAQNVVGAKMDGVWGPDSDKRHTATVKRVQEAIGVTADGIYGNHTAGKITVLRRKAR